MGEKMVRSCYVRLEWLSSGDVFEGNYKPSKQRIYVDMLNRERDDLMDTLTEQKAVLGQVRQREFEAYNQVKKSCHMVEQAQLEKAEVNGEMNG